MTSDVAPEQGRSTQETILIAAAIVAAASVGILAGRADPSDNAVAGIALAMLAGLAVIVGTQRTMIVVGAVAYILAIQVIYDNQVVLYYAYSGLVDTGAGGASLLIVAALGVAPALWLPGAVQRPSEIVLWFLYLFGYVPAVVIPIYILGPELTAVLPLDVMVAIGFITILLMQRIPRPDVHWQGLTDRRFHRALLGLGIACLAFLAIFFGVPTQLPDFVTGYVVRAEFGAAATDVPGAGYIVTWAGNVIFPMLIASGLSGSHRRALLLGIAGQLLIYSLDGAKAILFSLAVIPVVFALLKWWPRRFGLAAVWGALALVVIGAVATAITGSAWPISVLVVRLVALPGQLTAYYYDFFSTHATYLLSHSILKAFTASPYILDPPFQIGGAYFHVVVDANANLWADAMANFGLLGIVPVSIALGGVLWIADSIAGARSLLIIGPVFAIAGIELSNGALLTSIMSDGIGLAIVMAALMPNLTQLGASRHEAPASGGPLP